MFKSLSSRSTRPTSSQSGSSSTYTQNTSSSSSSTYTPLPALPPIPPSPERDTIPAIRLVSATPGKSPQSSPLLEKRRTRTLVPRRSVRGKENQPQSETSFTGSLETSTLPPVVDSMHVTGLVARQFAAHHDRQFHSVGPSTGLSLPLASQEHSSSSSAKGSLKVKSGLKHKRVLVESRAYPDGGQVEVVKDTIGRRSSKPALLESVRGTITGTVKGGTVRGENEENAGAGTAGLVVKKKKSRGTLDSIRWALGDRTNAAARKAEKEGQTEEKERKKATSVAERPKATRPTINTHIPREVPLETPITSAVLSPMSATTTGTMTGVTTDSESAAASGTEKTGKWRWTIGKRRAKSPGPSLSSTFDRPAHVRSNSLDPNALMASLHPDESEEAAYTNLSPRASSLELPPLSYTAAAEEAAQNLCSPISSSRPMPVEASSRPISIATSSRPTPVETAPVDFGFQPATVRKVSTGSVESGATRKSSIGSLLSGDNASNTGSFAIRAMRSVRSMASLARIGGWVKGDEDETEKVEKKEKKTGTVKEKKKRRLRKKVIVEEEDATNTSGESWEAGELNRDPTVTVTVPIGKPIIGRQNVYVRHERADLGVRRISEGDEDWPRAGRRSSSGSSFAAPSTISSGSYQQSRMSRASSDAHTVRSRQDSVPAAPNVPANPSIIFEHQEEAPAVAEIPASADGPSATYLGDNAWVGVGADTLKGRTQGAELGRRARKPVIGLFDIPTAEESQSKAPESPPHVEVRGTKIGKGCVRERVRAFEARVEENAGSSATFSASTGRKVSLPILPNATLGRAAVSEVNDQQLSFIQEREYTLSSKRCVSVPLPRPSTSPERPTRSRPWSEQMLRADDEAAIDILNAANSDLSDLISRLDLSATPDTKLASPEARRIPAWVEDSPSRRPRGEQQILTGLLGYNHPSLAKPVQKLLLAEPDDLFTPRALQLPPRATKASGGVSAKSSNDSGRTRIESRHHTGMNTTFGEDSIVEGDDTNADISDELQVLLLGGVETEQPLPSPGMPPNVPLPQPIEGVEIPRVVIEDTTETQLNVVLGSEYSEADEEMERGSRKSFDFTEELGQLKGGSRNSFVEVLVTAFNPPGTDIDEQLQLNVDSLNRLSGATERGSSVVAQEPTAHDAATEAEISFSRAEALAKLTRKSSDQLKLDFQFGPTRETAPQEDSVGTALADSTFALALANLSQAGGDKGTVKRRDATIRFKLDTDSQDMRGEPRASSNSTSSLGNLFHPTTSDPFGFNPSQSANTSRANRHSLLSVPSVYRMPNIPQDDPFDYESLMRELDEASAMVDDPNHGLARRRRSKRMSVDSDRSSFYCRTNAPPVTFHNRGFGRHLGQSLENGSLGVNASRLSWGRHYPEESADSDGYDRPGLGDKMFQTGVEHGMPLPSIMASPTNSEVSTGPQFYYEQHTGKYSYVSDHRRNSYLSERRESYAPSMVEQRRMSFASYDSLVDGAGDERRYSIDMESL
ncbi:hypothetical protein FRC09_005957 [Ceratobasidium sp. 395]|nr:hypothetical protein FRC09_005957 [Ceratobasidium sp. 395]